MDITFEDVVQHISDYFKKHLPLYIIFEVRKQSYNPDDDYLYMVAAKHKNETYAVWTSWNEQMQSLNHGHYNLPDMKSCSEIISDFQNAHNTYKFESTPLEYLRKLLIKHNDNFEDSCQQIDYVAGFCDGIAAQQENKWYEMTESEKDILYQEALKE